MVLKAYNPAWPLALATRDRAARWQRQQQLSAPQLAQIEAAYPLDFYRPVWPLRVGLFLATCLAISTGSVFIIASSAAISGYGFPWVLSGLAYAVGCTVALEYFIRKNHHFRSGVDNALLYAALGASAGLIFYIFFEYFFPRSASNFEMLPAVLPLTLVLGLLLAAVVRYADALVTAAAVGTLFTIIVLLAMYMPLLFLLLPLVFLLTAAGLLYVQGRVAQRPDADYYHSARLTLKALALAILYLSVNYLVVREGSNALSSQMVADGQGSSQIAFAPVFYFFTAAIPLAYIALGLRRHDRLLLIMGLLALAFSIFTLRYYRSLLPAEIAATIGGAVLIVGAGAALRYLRPSRFGLTSEDDDEPRHFNLENLIVSQTAGSAVPGAPNQGLQFGGGQSGGGGATGAF